jgi:hypothetical protein
MEALLNNYESAKRLIEEAKGLTDFLYMRFDIVTQPGAAGPVGCVSGCTTTVVGQLARECAHLPRTYEAGAPVPWASKRCCGGSWAAWWQSKCHTAWRGRSSRVLHHSSGAAGKGVRPSAKDLRGWRSGAVDIEAVLRGQLGSVVAHGLGELYQPARTVGAT